MRAVPILATAAPWIVISDLTFGNSVECSETSNTFENTS